MGQDELGAELSHVDVIVDDHIATHGVLREPGRDLLSALGAGSTDRRLVDDAAGEPLRFEHRLQFGDRLAMPPGGRDHDLGASAPGAARPRYGGTLRVETQGTLRALDPAAKTATALGKPDTGRKIALKVYGTSGWDPDAFLMPGVDLAFDTISYKNFPVVVLNLNAPSALLGFQLGGIVGHKFLSKYRVAIDLERSVLRLKNVS